MNSPARPDSPSHPDLEGLKVLLAPGPDLPWQDHDGGGRPNKPTDYCEIELRDGRKQHCDSAFIRWCWTTPEDEDQDPNDDIIRWRPAKAPPSKMFLAACVPSLIAHVERIERRLEQAADALEDARDALDAAYVRTNSTDDLAAKVIADIECGHARATLSQGTSHE